MPSFDIVSQIDYQEVLNAINGVQREIGNRYDFKNVKWSLELEKKEKQMIATAESEYALEQIQSSLKGCFVKRKLDTKALEFQTPEKASGNSLRQTIKIKEGIDSKLKVQASIQGQELRVSGKSKNDLQATIQLVKDLNLELPLQFINFRD